MRRRAVLCLPFAACFAAPFSAGAQSGANTVHSQSHKGTGVVRSIDRAGGKVTLKHDPIKSLNWPTMTMAFAVQDKAMLDSLRKDRKVEFEFVLQGDQFVITSIR